MPKLPTPGYKLDGPKLPNCQETTAADFAIPPHVA